MAAGAGGVVTDWTDPCTTSSTGVGSAGRVSGSTLVTACRRLSRGYHARRDWSRRLSLGDQLRDRIGHPWSVLVVVVWLDSRLV